LRVLVIDDEKNVADTLVMILQRSGWQATAAYDGATAVEKADVFLPTVVISDVIMPRMNGIEACTAIKAKHPQCHIVLFSGQAATSDLVRDAWARGFRGELLAKPIEPDDLLAKLASLPKQGSAAADQQTA